MPITIFDLPTWDRIFSYQSHEYIYKHIRHINKQMQKAAIIELVSRRSNSRDIFYQEKLFEEIKFIPSYLKVDMDFQKTLCAQVIASSKSPFSTPKHRNYSWIFLSLFQELPSNFLSYERLTHLILLWRLREDSYSDYNDNYLKRLLALLPSKQVNHLIENYIEHELSLISISDLITNRPIPPEMEASIDSFVKNDPLPIGILDEEKLATLKKIYCHMNSEQRSIIIKKCFELININYSFFQFYFQIIALCSMYANEQHAYDIFHGMIVIVLSDNCDTNYHKIMSILRSLAHKLKSTTELLDLMLNTHNNFIHTDRIFYEILYLLGKTSPEAADRVFMRIYAKHYSLEFEDKLDKLIAKISNNYAKKMIEIYIHKIALTTKKIGYCTTFEHEALDILSVLSSKINKDEASKIFEKLILIFQCKDSNQIFVAYHYALLTLKKIAFQLNFDQRQAAIQILFDILNDSSAKSEHVHVLETFSSMIVSLSQEQIDDIFMKIILVLQGEHKDYLMVCAAITLLINLKSHINDSRLSQLISSIKALKDKKIDNNICKHLLYLMKEFSPMLSVYQIRDVFPILLGIGSFDEHNIKLEWCLSIKDHLPECDIKFLIDKLLLEIPYRELNKVSDEMVCNISLIIENKLSSEQRLRLLYRIFNILMHENISNSSYDLIRAIATDTASIFVSKLTHVQVQDLFELVIQSHNLDFKKRLFYLKMLFATLNSTQINDALTLILDVMKVENQAENLNDGDSEIDNTWIKEAIDVLTYFIPKLNLQQIDNICLVIRDLIFSNVSLWNSNEVSNSLSIFFHNILISEKSDFKYMRSLLLPTNEITKNLVHTQDHSLNIHGAIENKSINQFDLILMEVFLFLEIVEHMRMMLTSASPEKSPSF